MCFYTNVAAWFYFVIPPKNVKNVINRFYQSELRNRCGFVVYFVIPPKNVKNVVNRFYQSELRNRCGFVLYCLTAAERFD